jgi:hypothetical protein
MTDIGNFKASKTFQVPVGRPTSPGTSSRRFLLYPLINCYPRTKLIIQETSLTIKKVYYGPFLYNKFIPWQD